MTRRRWTWLGAAVALGVALDQVTKYVADLNLAGRGRVVVIDGFFELRYARNPGAFFSLGADLAPMVRRGLFITASTVAILLIGRLYLRSEPDQGLQRGGLLFLLAGAFGNLVDRVIAGEVIDFVHLYWRGVFDWATFNVADVWIVVGVLLLVADLFRRQPAKAGPEETAEPLREGA